MLLRTNEGFLVQNQLHFDIWNYLTLDCPHAKTELISYPHTNNYFFRRLKSVRVR